MIFGSHGAVRSFCSVTARLPHIKPMRFLKARGASHSLFPESSRCCRRRPFSSLSRARLYRGYSRMSTRKTAHQVWHVSRGIVFAGGSSVVYPRLPQVRCSSAPAAIASEETAVSVPDASFTGNVPEVAPVGQGAEGAPGRVTTALETPRTITTIISTSSTTTTTAVVVGDSAAKEDLIPAEDATKDAVESKPKDAVPRSAPFTPLEFKIPDKAFQDAAKAAEGTPQSFWNYTLYRRPADDGAPDTKVKVHYCTSSRTTERVIKEYFLNEKVLGFDLEWMPNAVKAFGPRSNVSLVQLASPSRIGLFHIAVYPKNDTLVAPSLKKVLEDPEITKVGVWIKGDSTRLSEFLGINPRGQFELSHLYKLVKYSKSGEYDLINKKLAAMATQVKEVLGLPMFKGNDVRASDWSKPLNMDQIIYSSSDAYAAMQLYAVLDHQRKALDPVPPLPRHAELNLPIPVTKPAPPPATEAEDAEPDAAVKESTGAEGKILPEDEAVLEETIVREDVPAPETQLVLADKAALVDQATPEPGTNLINRTTPTTALRLGESPAKTSVTTPPIDPKPSSATEPQPQAEPTPKPKSRSLAEPKSPGPAVSRKPRGRPPAKAKAKETGSVLPAKLIPAQSLSLFPAPNQTPQPPNT